MRARAAVAVEPWRVEFQDVEVPEPGPDDVVVRVTHSWISNGTEGSFVRGERIAGDTPWREGDPMPFPIVTGYQKVGIVEAIGANVIGLQPGQRVFATVSRIEGMFDRNGGHISPAVTHRSQVWPLPEGVDSVAFSGLVLTQVGYNAGARPAVQPGDAAIVLGDGMVGHWTAQTLRHRGARVLLAGRHDDRLDRFVAEPGDRLVNTKRESLLDVIREWAPEGAQVLAHTAGELSDVEALYPVVRRDAHLVSAGFVGTRGAIDVQKMRARELTLHTPAGWSPERMDATLDLVARGVLTTLPLVTHRFPAERAGEAFDLVLRRREPVLGVILEWGEE